MAFGPHTSRRCGAAGRTEITQVGWGSLGPRTAQDSQVHWLCKNPPHTVSANDSQGLTPKSRPSLPPTTARAVSVCLLPINGPPRWDKHSAPFIRPHSLHPKKN